MRAFKFRVYDEKKNCWVVDYIQYYPMDTFVKQGHTIQQFTGILDKNLREIYEGDYVKAKNGIVYTCKYSNEEAAFILEFVDSFVYLSDFDSIEVVGNIFDNPELNNEN